MLDHMGTISRNVSAGELRDRLSHVVGRVGFAGERVGVTKHGKLAAVMISVEDFELLEQLEAARDLAEFRAAKEADDGGRVSLEELRSEIAE